jgi:hypothetical protein
MTDRLPDAAVRERVIGVEETRALVLLVPAGGGQPVVQRAEPTVLLALVDLTRWPFGSDFVYFDADRFKVIGSNVHVTYRLDMWQGGDKRLKCTLVSVEANL